MEKSESIINLVTATIKVMEAVKGIDKTMVIGTGQNTYKGVPDKEVKKIIGDEMVKNGLAIFPIGISDTIEVSQWDEQYNGQPKRKQSVFTKVTTTYLLTHVSGEYVTLQGYGHGVDSQDKAAGKATTYALKYALLYMFMVPTGKIDDADIVHSESIEVPSTNEQEAKRQATRDLAAAIVSLDDTKTVEDVKKVWDDNQHLHINKEFVKKVTSRKLFLKTE